ncbi:hypothetical protein [Catenovulum sediminis]|uniref:Uncharacterized protein n=1 Tax=Catenovulum sediminis TaxID=1740262 RepID=A0ABV1RHI6_9ALTE
MYRYPDDIRSYDLDPRSPLYIEPEVKSLDQRIEDFVGDDCFDFIAVIGADEINSIIGYHLNGDSDEMGKDLARVVRVALIRKLECMGE